jgi:hypothetical protein
MARHLVILIRLPSNHFSQATHHPRDTAQPPAQFRELLRISDEHLNLEVRWLGNRLILVPAQRKNEQPPPSDLFIRPLLDEIGSIPQHTMKVVAEHGKGHHIDGKKLSEKLHPLLNLVFPKRVVLAGSGIDSTKKAPPDAPLTNMKDPDLVSIDYFTPRQSRHFLLLLE